MMKMASNRGKLFEREFRKGLLLLPGMGIRLYDGTNVARIQMPGDFIYAACSGKTFLIECKSTQENSFPYANFQPHQLPDLMRWQIAGNGNRYGLVAIEFWKHKRTFLISPYDIAYEKNFGERKSLTLDKAEQLGFEVKRFKDESGFAYTLGVLETGWK